MPGLGFRQERWKTWVSHPIIRTSKCPTLINSPSRKALAIPSAYTICRASQSHSLFEGRWHPTPGTGRISHPGNIFKALNARISGDVTLWQAGDNRCRYVSIMCGHLWPSKHPVLGSIVLSHALFVIYAQSFGLNEWRTSRVSVKIYASTQWFFGSLKNAKRRFQTLTAVKCTLLRCHSGSTNFRMILYKWPGICYVHPRETGRWLSSMWDQLTTLYSGKANVCEWKPPVVAVATWEHIIPIYPFRL